MKTIEQVVKGIEFRIENLTLQMTKLETLLETEPAAKAILQSTSERHNELSALLTFIKSEGCGPKACGGCATPCGSKRG